MTELLSLEDVSVAFGGLKALNQVSVKFPLDQITGLIGPNGSGKSTLVNAVTGEVPLASGRVHLGSRDITGLRGDRVAAAGLVRTYQVPRFPKELTAREVVTVPFRFLHHRSRPDPLAEPDAVLDFCSVDHDFDAPCSSLTVPQLRRLGIARALGCGPSVLMLDEVMASLPAHEAASATALVRRIRNVGIAVVIIEHVMRIIAEVCDSIFVLNLGAVLAHGTPRDVLTQPEVRTAYLGTGFEL